MTRSVKTIVSLVGIAAGAIIASIIAYYAGASFGGSIIAGSNMDLKKWQDAYQTLVVFMGIIIGIIAFIYYAVLRFVSEITSPYGSGKRLFWGVMLIIVFIIAMLFPYTYAGLKASVFRVNISIPLVFMIIYGFLYFWLGSILITPDTYKYTPIGATVFRGSKK